VGTCALFITNNKFIAIELNNNKELKQKLNYIVPLRKRSIFEVANKKCQERGL
jgi:hypothetical protein